MPTVCDLECRPAGRHQRVRSKQMEGDWAEGRQTRQGTSLPKDGTRYISSPDHVLQACEQYAKEHFGGKS